MMFIIYHILKKLWINETKMIYKYCLIWFLSLPSAENVNLTDVITFWRSFLIFILPDLYSKFKKGFFFFIRKRRPLKKHENQFYFSLRIVIRSLVTLSLIMFTIWKRLSFNSDFNFGGRPEVAWRHLYCQTGRGITTGIWWYDILLKTSGSDL